MIFLMFGPLKEDIFLTTIYGLYFSHQYTFYKLQSFSHVVRYSKKRYLAITRVQIPSRIRGYNSTWVIFKSEL